MFSLTFIILSYTNAIILVSKTNKNIQQVVLYAYNSKKNEKTLKVRVISTQSSFIL